MIELMLKLLTYEPYEKVSGNEKDYIDNQKTASSANHLKKGVACL